MIHLYNIRSDWDHCLRYCRDNSLIPVDSTPGFPPPIDSCYCIGCALLFAVKMFGCSLDPVLPIDSTGGNDVKFMFLGRKC